MDENSAHTPVCASDPRCAASEAHGSSDAIMTIIELVHGVIVPSTLAGSSGLPLVGDEMNPRKQRFFRGQGATGVLAAARRSLRGTPFYESLNRRSSALQAAVQGV